MKRGFLNHRKSFFVQVFIIATILTLKNERRFSIMAIYHLCIKIISRGKGKSAVAASAYRSGEKIKTSMTVQSTTLQEKAEQPTPKFYYHKMHHRNFQTGEHYGIAWRKQKIVKTHCSALSCSFQSVVFIFLAL